MGLYVDDANIFIILPYGSLTSIGYVYTLNTSTIVMEGSSKFRTKWRLNSVNKTLANAYQFFYDNAGYATPPGKAVCAIPQARLSRRLLANLRRHDQAGLRTAGHWRRNPMTTDRTKLRRHPGFWHALAHLLYHLWIKG